MNWWLFCGSAVMVFVAVMAFALCRIAADADTRWEHIKRAQRSGKEVPNG